MNTKTLIIISAILVFLLIGYFLVFKRTQSLPTSVSLYSPAPPPVITTIPLTPVPTPTPDITPTSTPTPTPKVSPVSKVNTVVYTDSGYSPKTLTIKKGETVTFLNQSTNSMWPASAMHPTHTVYSGTSISEHCPDTAGIAFDACTGIPPGQSWSFKFNKVGTWRYHDHINPGFTGTIVVNE